MSLAGVLAACQTAKSPDDLKARDKAVMETQKGLVRTALDSGKPEQALQYLRDLVRENPDDAALHNLMGLTQLALKNADRAVLHFRRAYKLDPQAALGLNLSSAYIENGDYERAIALLKSLLKPVAGKGAAAKPYQYKERIYHNIGYAYVRQNQLTKALQWLQEALDENPTFFPSHLEIARIYERTRRPALAMRSYRTAMDYCHVCFEPVRSLAQLYIKSNRHAEARQVLLRFAQIEGVETADRTEAERLLKVATLDGTKLAPRPKKGG